MKQRLLLLTAFSSALVLLVLAVALGPLVRPRATEKLEIELRTQILAIATFVAEHPTEEQAREFLADVDTSPNNRIGLVSSSVQQPVGRDAARLQRWIDPQRSWRITAFDVAPADWPGALYPRFFTEPNGDRVASQGVKDGTTFWIIEGTITDAVIGAHERRQWLIVAGLGAVAMAVAMAGAALVARRLTRPLNRAVAAAEALGSGDLTAPVPVTGPREVVELGNSLNRLAGRIDRLLISERERAANLSHRLRTPLTALRLESERLADHADTRTEERTRVLAAIAELERGLDDVIRQSLQTREDGMTDHADAAVVLRKHVEYWAAAAEAQRRTITTAIRAGKFPVALSAKDLGIALDAIFSNAFRHTSVGTQLTAELTAAERAVTIKIADSGSGHNAATEQGGEGSTGMGLKIAGDILRSAGGSLTTTRTPDGGFLVSLILNLQ